MTKLGKHERVHVAWAERAVGPGWSNLPIWVLVSSADGRYRVECIQPSEQTSEMSDHFEYSALATAKLTAAVRSALEEKPVAALQAENESGTR